MKGGPRFTTAVGNDGQLNFGSDDGCAVTRSYENTGQVLGAKGFTSAVDGEITPRFAMELNCLSKEFYSKR
jgi:hypothetical protein